ncbi:MAG: GNAT family N-acetyltransferase [Chloroflexi bacterium]|nr:GNAT family N-acetyltransferase [Chloroflexota bacterium]
MVDVDAFFDDFPVLETERLVLRQIRPSDTTAIYALFSDEAVTRHYGLETFTAVEQAAQRIAAMRQNYQKRRSIRWAITTQGDDALIGSVGLMNLRPKFFNAAVGYELAPAYWRRGVMTEALTAVIEFSFVIMALNRIEAFVVPENTPSIHLLEKLGFVHEGLMREYGYWRQAFHDLHLFALLRKEWPGAATPDTLRGAVTLRGVGTQRGDR